MSDDDAGVNLMTEPQSWVLIGLFTTIMLGGMSIMTILINRSIDGLRDEMTGRIDGLAGRSPAGANALTETSTSCTAASAGALSPQAEQLTQHPPTPSTVAHVSGGEHNRRMYMSIESIAVVISAAGLLLGFVSAFAWMVVRMDRGFERVNDRISGVERELVEVKIAVARIEGPGRHLITAR